MFHLFHNLCWTTSNDALFVQNLFDYPANAVTGLEWNLFEVCRRVIVFHIISVTLESHEQSNRHSFLSYFFVHLNVYNVLLFLNNRSNFLPPATKLRQSNVFTPVCDSVHRGRGLCQGDPPPERDPPRQRLPGQTPLDRDRPWTESPPGQRPPCTETSGRYASYWNVFLLNILRTSCDFIVNLFQSVLFSSDFSHQNSTIYNPYSKILLESIIFTSTWSAMWEILFCNLLLKGEKQEEESC